MIVVLCRCRLYTYKDVTVHEDSVYPETLKCVVSFKLLHHFGNECGDLSDRQTMLGKTIGQLAELDPTSNSVSVYDEQAQLFFQANEIAVAKCVAVFLITIEEGRIYYCETSWHQLCQNTNHSMKPSLN